jgi:hypothetical protein
LASLKAGHGIKGILVRLTDIAWITNFNAIKIRTAFSDEHKPRQSWFYI